jgi:hypothetical protein
MRRERVSRTRIGFFLSTFEQNSDDRTRRAELKTKLMMSIEHRFEKVGETEDVEMDALESILYFVYNFF